MRRVPSVELISKQVEGGASESRESVDWLFYSYRARLLKNTLVSWSEILIIIYDHTFIINKLYIDTLFGY
jgi:hypothetical protein